jgi:LmbE family N-acetylglucosaminyl deacetylase
VSVRADEALVSLARLLLGLGLDPAAAAGRWLLVAAHPDDETIGATWLLPRARDLHLLHVTDGAPFDRRLWPADAGPTREAYAAVRRAEVEAALALAGVPPSRLHTLGFEDQHPSHRLRELTVAMESELEFLQPAVVVVQPFEGGHPDHDATAFAVHAALRRLGRRGRPLPALVEMTSYHRLGGALRTEAFLPAPPPQQSCLLTPAERRLKQQMLACFRSQVVTLAPFGADSERFRRCPAYGFAAPPHPGLLHYEALGWMRGRDWCRLARRALRQLGLAPLPEILEPRERLSSTTISPTAQEELLLP